MSLDPDTPQNQYQKITYCVRIVARVPRHVDESTMRDSEFRSQGLPQPNFKMYGTTLCALDVTMAHVAAMYATGRLMDSIRNPFNASVIRAEMDALRDRNIPDVSSGELDDWQATQSDDKRGMSKWRGMHWSPQEMRQITPSCPYLFQLAWKSFHVGNQPPYWSGAREFTGKPGGAPPMHMLGRAGIDTFRPNVKENATVMLYIDATVPLQPRYAFMLYADIQGMGAQRSGTGSSNRFSPSLRIFSAYDMAVKYILPEAELFSDVEPYSENHQQHTPGRPGGARRYSLTLYSRKERDRILADPKYIRLHQAREERARTHPAVVRMAPFGWLRRDDIIRLDGTALLQEIWQAGYIVDDDFEILHAAIEQPESISVTDSQPVDYPNPHPTPSWRHFDLSSVSYHTGQELSLKAAATDTFLTKHSCSLNPAEHGGILAQIAEPTVHLEYAMLKLHLAHRLWVESSKGGNEEIERAYQWLHTEGDQASDLDQSWTLDYEADAQENEHNVPKLLWSVIFYQALCYRGAVALERQSRRVATEDRDALDSSTLSHLFGLSEIPEEVLQSDFPGQALGDVAHPAFDVSHFPLLREDDMICALKVWSDHVWLPDLDCNDWSFDSAARVPIRTLNVSGCHCVTQSTIRRALQTVPTITRIIMVACPNFSETDLNLLSLDGTLDTVDCILTTDVCRGPFRHYADKTRRRDRHYEAACALLPEAPNEDVKQALSAVPEVLLRTTSSFEFKYNSGYIEVYVPDGLYNRRPTHTFARPPSLGFDPETCQLKHGPPRLTILLDSNTTVGSFLTGATLPRIPIDEGIDSDGTHGLGLTTVWRGITDLIEFLGYHRMRNVQRQEAVQWSLLVKSCFSETGTKWGKKGGLAGGSEFYGFPPYFKGAPGQANEEWMFAYCFRDAKARVASAYTSNSIHDLVQPKDLRNCWAFIRFGRDGNPLSEHVPTVVLYDVQGFRRAVCPDLPISRDEAKWISRAEWALKRGTWSRDHAMITVAHDRTMMEQGNPMLEKMKKLMERYSPMYMKENVKEVVRLMDRVKKCQMNDGKDMF